MPFTIVRRDITEMNVDAVVNAANTELLMGGGVCGAIFKAAGACELQEACDTVSPVKTGGAALTPAFRLPAKYVIHAVGPVYSSADAARSEALLRSAYSEALRIAKENDCGSIAFPLISSGIFGYPKAEALKVATDAIRSFLEDNDMEVYLAVFDAGSFAVSEKLMGSVESYIDDHYVEAHSEQRRTLLNVERMAFSSVAPDVCAAVAARPVPPAAAAGEPFAELDEPFSAALFRIIDAKGKSDAEVYKRANIDRRLFSKIRSAKGYMPGKRTILALAIALELSLSETDDLLERAGYALSHSQRFDVIVEYFIVNGKYDIFEINEVLFKFDQPLLGA